VTLNVTTGGIMSLMLALALFFSGAALALTIITLRLRKIAYGLISGDLVPHDYDDEV